MDTIKISCNFNKIHSGSMMLSFENLMILKYGRSDWIYYSNVKFACRGSYCISLSLGSTPPFKNIIVVYVGATVMYLGRCTEMRLHLHREKRSN